MTSDSVAEALREIEKAKLAYSEAVYFHGGPQDDLEKALDAAIARYGDLREKAALEAVEVRFCHHGWRGSRPQDGQRIVTPCPACGCQSLFIANGGHLTCSRVPDAHGHSQGCPDPSVEEAFKHKIAAARLAGRIEQAEKMCSIVQDNAPYTDETTVAYNACVEERDRLRRGEGV